MLLDTSFIEKAEKITSFNIDTKDFESLDHKKEIQYLFQKHFFYGFDLKSTTDDVDQDTLNELIKELRGIDATNFENLFTYSTQGVGPGEVMLYFLMDNAYLGGGSKAGVDLIVDDSQYEIKAVAVTDDRKAYDFKLGSTFSLSNIMDDINEVRINADVGGSNTEISASKINEMRLEFPDEFIPIEQEFAKLSYENYFQHHPIIFLNRNKSKAKRGTIEKIKVVQEEDIQILACTSGTIKPKIDIS